MTPRQSPDELPWPTEVYGWPGSTFAVPDAFKKADEPSDGLEVAEFSVPWNEWLIDGKAVYLAQQIVISELTIRIQPDTELPTGGISSTTLNLPLGQIRDELLRTHIQSAANFARAILDLPDKPEAVEAPPARRGRRPYSDEELRAIARLYLEVQSQPGGRARIAEEMAQRLGETVSTVNKKVRRATERGFLGTAVQGRGGRLPGPLLEVSR